VRTSEFAGSRSPNDHHRSVHPFNSLSQHLPIMKIKTSFQDVKTSDGTTMRVYIYEPNLPEYPQASWPGVVCFSGQSIEGYDSLRADGGR
jgi:hypothetical protein